MVSGTISAQDIQSIGMFTFDKSPNSHIIAADTLLGLSIEIKSMDSDEKISPNITPESSNEKEENENRSAIK